MVKALEKQGIPGGACSQLDAFGREFEEKNKTCMAIENFMMEFLERGKGAASHSVACQCVECCLRDPFSYGELKTRVFQLVERDEWAGKKIWQRMEAVREPCSWMVVMIEQYLVDNYQRNIRAGEFHPWGIWFCIRIHKPFLEIRGCFLHPGTLQK